MADINAIQNAIATKRQEIGQRYADIPQIESKIRGDLYGGDKTLASLQENEAAKIKELYDHDRRMADTYANPQSGSYLADPYAREKALSFQSGATAGEIATIQNQIGTRKDIIGDALEKAMKLLSYGLEASKFEYSGLQDELNTAMKLQEAEERRREKGSGALAKQKKDAEIAQAIQYLLTQTKDRGEAKQDIASMAGRFPDSAPEIYGLLDELFPQTESAGLSAEEMKMIGIGEDSTQESIRLVDPSSRQIVEYDGIDDPDYFNDLQKGFIPY